MNKTIHKKLIANSSNHTAPLAALGNTDQATFMREFDLLMASSKKLFQPRPQAVANILKLAKDL